MFSSHDQEEDAFLSNQVKYLNYLKKTAEILHDKEITENCFKEDEENGGIIDKINVENVEDYHPIMEITEFSNSIPSRSPKAISNVILNKPVMHLNL